MIEKIILEHNIPLSSSGIKYIEIDPTDVNIFVSVNGSGKSSLIRELNQLPPDNANYHKNGRKYVKGTKNGISYELDSYTHKSTGHSFIWNGEQKNPGGTLTVQKQLVVEFFNLDDKLNRMLSGTKYIDLLSGMSPGRRKDIFMQMYPNDTTYAMGVYNRLKEERNNLKGAIKNQVTRAAEERRKLESLSDIKPEELEEKIKSIDSTLKDVFMIRGSLNNAKLDRDVQFKINRMETLAERLLLDSVTLAFDSRNELERSLEDQTRILDYNNKKITQYETLINDIHKVINSFGVIDMDPALYQTKLDALNEDIKNTEIKQQGLKAMLAGYPVLSESGDWTQYVNLFNEFKLYLNGITVASHPTLTGAEYQSWVNHKNKLTNDLSGYEKSLEAARHKIKHYESADTVECPECTSKFKIGFTLADINATKEMIAALVKRIDSTVEEIKSLENKIENDASWFGSMNRLYSFIREHQELRVLSTLVTEYNIGKVPSESLLNGSQTLSELFHIDKRMIELNYEKDALESRIRVLESNNIGDLNKRLRSYKDSLAYHMLGKTYGIRNIQKINKSIKALDDYDTQLNVLQDLKTDIWNALVENGRHNLMIQLDAAIASLSSKKERHISDVIRSKSLNSVVESIDANLMRLRKRIKMVTVLMDGLCPNKGLIGKLMTDFITNVCGNMNALIRSVWCSPLYIKPCAKENGDLNYKFPVINSEDHERTCPDLSECSAGEQDMLNFAFRYVMWRYHGNEYPLFMDEVGVYFDENHRNRFFKEIEQKVTSGDVQQLFMISHYANQYGLFKDPNLIVINGEGLTINGEINTRVKIR